LWQPVTSWSSLPDLQPIAAGLLWVYLLYFLQVLSSTGPYVRMIFKIMLDMKPFMTIVCIVLVAFGHVFLLATKLPQDSFQEALLRTYRMGMMGDFELELGDEGNSISLENSLQTKFAFLLCTMFTTVIILNVLIAVISDSYDDNMDKCASAIAKGKAQVIQELEQVFGKSAEHDYLLLFMPESQTAQTSSGGWKNQKFKASINSMDKMKNSVDMLQGLQIGVNENMKADLNELNQRQADMNADMNELKQRLDDMIKLLGSSKRSFWS